MEQKGSLVNPNYLRFDFSHFTKIDQEQLDAIEKEVNQLIRADYSKQEYTDMPMEEAQKMGAIALFGEKYGDTVRIIKFGDSIELCGGTHVRSSSRVGSFIITNETSVAAGVRRIEAITSEAADQKVQSQLDEYNQIKSLFQANQSVPEEVKKLIDQQKEQSRMLESLNARLADYQKEDLLNNIETIDDKEFLGCVIDIDPGAIKKILLDLKKTHEKLIAIIGTKSNNKAVLNILVGDALAGDDMNAGQWVQELAQKHIKGNGGGQAFFATAGGSDPSGLQSAVDELRTRIEQ